MVRPLKEIIKKCKRGASFARYCDRERAKMPHFPIILAPHDNLPRPETQPKNLTQTDISITHFKIQKLDRICR